MIEPAKVHADNVADFVFGLRRKTQFANELDGLDFRFFELTHVGLVDFVFFDFAEAELNRAVAVGVDGLVANDDVVAGFDDSDGNDATFLRENLRHAEFNA